MFGRSTDDDLAGDFSVIASTFAIGVLSLACRLVMTAAIGGRASVTGTFEWLPLLMVCGLTVIAGVYFRSRPILTFGFGAAIVSITFICLPDATEAALHFGRGFAYADAQLAAADRLIGFDWLGYARWMDAHSSLWTTGRYAYLSMPLLPFAVVIVLSLSESPQRLATYLVTQMLCLSILAGIAIFVPALGTYEFYHAAGAPFIHQDFVTANHMTQSLEWLRKSNLEGNGVSYHGLVSFPSYHAMSCALNAWALWRVRWVGWSMAALSLLILVATPVQGSHYMVDVLAGLVIAYLAIKPSTWIVLAFARRRPRHVTLPVLVPA